MDILKLLPPHNTMSEKIIYRQWCRKIDRSQSRLSWYLLTPNLNCAKHDVRSKRVEPHLEFSYARRSISRYHCSAIISLSTAVFYVKPLLLNVVLNEFVISLCNPIADEFSTLINEVNASTTFSSDGVPSSW